MKKKIYSSPDIERIKLDNGISLALESSPPVMPGETALSTPESLNEDIFLN